MLVGPAKTIISPAKVLWNPIKGVAYKPVHIDLAKGGKSWAPESTTEGNVDAAPGIGGVGGAPQPTLETLAASLDVANVGVTRG